MTDNLSTTDQAKQLSKDILDDLEIKNTPISQILFKTMRLARIMHDVDAQVWIFHLINGYPIGFKKEVLGKYKNYFSGALTIDNSSGKAESCSLPFCESMINDISGANFSSSR